jgi:hypothetical protein
MASPPLVLCAYSMIGRISPAVLHEYPRWDRIHRSDVQTKIATNCPNT